LQIKEKKMQAKVKQRTIGALVILALILTGSLIISHRAKNNQGYITKVLPLPARGLTQPVAQSQLASAGGSNQAAQAQVATVATSSAGAGVLQPQASVTVNNAPLPVKSQTMSLTQRNNLLNPKGSWVMQVATFHQQANAKNLVSRLKKAQFDVFLKTDTTSKSHPIYRVFIGPEMSKKMFVTYKKSLWSHFKLHGGIVRAYQSQTTGA
jgi:DedD protein